MGVTYVTAVVRNLAEPKRAWEGLFLVDTGATDCMIPRNYTESVGLEPKGQRAYELADGRGVMMDVTTGEVEILGEVIGATIVIGDSNGEPLLGLTALESAGIEVDPSSGCLKKRRTIRLKAASPA